MCVASCPQPARMDEGATQMMLQEFRHRSRYWLLVESRFMFPMAGRVVTVSGASVLSAKEPPRGDDSSKHLFATR